MLAIDVPIYRDHKITTPAVLVGASRQTPWADRIRREALAKLDDSIVRSRNMLADDRFAVSEAMIARILDRKVNIRARLMAQTSATKIIEARFFLADLI